MIFDRPDPIRERAAKMRARTRHPSPLYLKGITASELSVIEEGVADQMIADLNDQAAQAGAATAAAVAERPPEPRPDVRARIEARKADRF